MIARIWSGESPLWLLLLPLSWLYGLASGTSDFPTIIALAQRCGALATTAKGAMTALPYRRDLD